jgi:hypothetical protein
LVPNSEGAESFERPEKAVSPTYFNTQYLDKAARSMKHQNLWKLDSSSYAKSKTADCSEKENKPKPSLHSLRPV